MQGHAKDLRRLLHLGRHGNVGLAGGWVARRVVVHQDDRRGVQFEGAFDHLARVDGHVIDGALGLFLIRDQDVLAVEKQDAELFGFAVGHRGVAVVQQRIPGRQDRAVQNLGPHQALGRGFDDFQVLDHRFPDAFDQSETGGGGGDHAAEVAERVQQQPGEGFDVLPWDRPEQQEFEQFVVGHGGGPAVHEPGAQAFAVVGDVGGQLAGQGFGGRFVVVPKGKEGLGVVEAAGGHAAEGGMGMVKERLTGCG